MKILIDINHPADVHQFKHMIWGLQKKGHEFLLIARNKECTFKLLDKYGFKYIKREGYGGLKKLIGLYSITKLIIKHAKRFKADLLIGAPGDCYISQAGWLLGIPSLIFDDTEFSTVQNWLTFPFATKVITPSCYWLNLGKKQVRYNGYHELAYLHPKYFTPKKSVVKKYGINPDKPYIVVRLVDWQASHDFNKNDIKNTDSVIEELSKHVKVYISSEKPMKNNPYLLKIEPEDLHDILFYAKMLIGESSTLASEAAVLGTPAIYISNSQRGYTIDQEKKYGLVYYFENQDKAMRKALALLKDKDLKKKWAKKREKMLNETIDVTEWMIDYVGGFK